MVGQSRGSFDHGGSFDDALVGTPVRPAYQKVTLILREHDKMFAATQLDTVMVDVKQMT